MDQSQYNNINIPNMIGELDKLYAKEEMLLKQINHLIKEYRQLQDDKCLMQDIIMHQSNKMARR